MSPSSVVAIIMLIPSVVISRRRRRRQSSVVVVSTVVSRRRLCPECKRATCHVSCTMRVHVVHIHASTSFFQSPPQTRKRCRSKYGSPATSGIRLTATSGNVGAPVGSGTDHSSCGPLGAPVEIMHGTCHVCVAVYMQAWHMSCRLLP